MFKLVSTSPLLWHLILTTLTRYTHSFSVHVGMCVGRGRCQARSWLCVHCTRHRSSGHRTLLGTTCLQSVDLCRPGCLQAHRLQRPLRSELWIQLQGSLCRLLALHCCLDDKLEDVEEQTLETEDDLQSPRTRTTNSSSSWFKIWLTGWTVLWTTRFGTLIAFANKFSFISSTKEWFQLVRDETFSSTVAEITFWRNLWTSEEDNCSGGVDRWIDRGVYWDGHLGREVLFRTDEMCTATWTLRVRGNYPSASSVPCTCTDKVISSWQCLSGGGVASAQEF